MFRRAALLVVFALAVVALSGCGRGVSVVNVTSSQTAQQAAIGWFVRHGDPGSRAVYADSSGLLRQGVAVNTVPSDASGSPVNASGSAQQYFVTTLTAPDGKHSYSIVVDRAGAILKQGPK